MARTKARMKLFLGCFGDSDVPAVVFLMEVDPGTSFLTAKTMVILGRGSPSSGVSFDSSFDSSFDWFKLLLGLLRLVLSL